MRDRKTTEQGVSCCLSFYGTGRWLALLIHAARHIGNGHGLHSTEVPTVASTGTSIELPRTAAPKAQGCARFSEVLEALSFYRDTCHRPSPISDYLRNLLQNTEAYSCSSKAHTISTSTLIAESSSSFQHLPFHYPPRHSRNGTCVSLSNSSRLIQHSRTERLWMRRRLLDSSPRT